MRAEEDVTGETLKHSELMAVIGGDSGIRRVAHKLVPRIDVGAADDNDVEGAACFRLVEGPGGSAFGVARCEVRGENCAPERDRIAIMQGAVDVRRREAHRLVVSVVEV